MVQAKSTNKTVNLFRHPFQFKVGGSYAYFVVAIKPCINITEKTTFGALDQTHKSSRLEWGHRPWRSEIREENPTSFVPFQSIFFQFHVLATEYCPKIIRLLDFGFNNINNNLHNSMIVFYIYTFQNLWFQPYYLGHQ